MRFPLPRFIQFYPTFRCNQDCLFCFNDASQKSEMSVDNALRLLSILTENGIEELDIMGGEPLLLDWMPDFVEGVLDEGIAVSLSTNGSRPDAIRMLGRLRCERLTIGVSLEGSTEVKHNRLTRAANFSAVMKSIEELLSSGLNPLAKTVVTRETMDDIQRIADLLKRKGVSRYYLIHMDMLSRGLRSSALGYPEFLSFYEKVRDANPDISILKVNASCFEKNTLPKGVRCAGGVRKLAVMPDGSVYPCNLFHHMRSFRLDNVFETVLMELWDDPKLDIFRHTLRNDCEARDCSNHSLCTGGCPAHGYFHCGNPDSVDIRCISAIH
jgi:radical SAM protein with 4Fe4S-binding SPASM domain